MPLFPSPKNRIMRGPGVFVSYENSDALKKMQIQKAFEPKVVFCKHSPKVTRNSVWPFTCISPCIFGDSLSISHFSFVLFLKTTSFLLLTKSTHIAHLRPRPKLYLLSPSILADEEWTGSTGKFVSEAFIPVTTNPQYDKSLFIY